MVIYKKFAKFYASGGYPRYSMKMARIFPDILGAIGARPQKILDLACGEGSFVREISKLGYEVHGLDRSKDMLRVAEKKAEETGVEVDFFRADMRDLSFEEEYEAVTCWFDSINYLLTEEDLDRAFRGIHRSLKEDGIFIFDVNTIYQLKTKWQENDCYVQRDNDKVFELHRTEYDPERDVATLKITAFEKCKDSWLRMDEEHKERGYRIDELEGCFKRNNFSEIARWDDPQKRTAPDEKSGKIWFVLRKEG